MRTHKYCISTVFCLVPLACSGYSSEPENYAEQQSAATSCVVPTAGMLITTNTTLCAGTFRLNVPAGSAAITVGADNVTVACTGTILQGPGPVGPYASPNVGFSVNGHNNVKFVGCAAKAFQYGAVITNSSAVTLDTVHFDDNYTDPDAPWVQDGYQGGGVRFENTTSSIVRNSTFERNWNGIELRNCSGMSVSGNTADHCTNWGALLAASNNNTLSANDFSWAYRGGLAYPDAWYAVDTRDSAGIVVDAGSSGNLIQGNNVRYGGDGIFLRAVMGDCATNNRIINNDVSYSPHNGIESWCDNNEFTGNTASYCNYGIWLGGSDNAKVISNTVVGSKIDGISVQIGEDRHSVYQDNTITNSGRVGMLLSGRQYQQWDTLDAWYSGPANSSHLIVQHNTFANNSQFDVFATSTRSLVLASNSLTVSKVNFGRETAVTSILGSFSGAAGRTPPTAAIAGPVTVRQGVPVTFDASGSKLSPKGGKLAFTWLIQEAGTSFDSGNMPPLLVGGTGTSKTTYTFTAPGTYDVDVSVTDGYLGSLATRTVIVTP